MVSCACLIELSSEWKLLLWKIRTAAASTRNQVRQHFGSQTFAAAALKHKWDLGARSKNLIIQFFTSNFISSKKLDSRLICAVPPPELGISFVPSDEFFGESNMTFYWESRVLFCSADGRALFELFESFRGKMISSVALGFQGVSLFDLERSWDPFLSCSEILGIIRAVFLST